MPVRLGAMKLYVARPPVPVPDHGRLQNHPLASARQQGPPKLSLREARGILNRHHHWSLSLAVCLGVVSVTAHVNAWAGQKLHVHRIVRVRAGGFDLNPRPGTRWQVRTIANPHVAQSIDWSVGVSRSAVQPLSRSAAEPLSPSAARSSGTSLSRTRRSLSSERSWRGCRRGSRCSGAGRRRA